MPKVVQGESEHSAQFTEAIRTIGFVCMDYDFRIGVSVKNMSLSLEFPAQLKEIIDLAIEHHPYSSIFVMNGLLTTGNVNNAEPTHAQPYCPIDVDPLIIGPAVDNRSTHLLHLGGIYLVFTITCNDSCNTTHIFSRLVFTVLSTAHRSADRSRRSPLHFRLCPPISAWGRGGAARKSTVQKQQPRSSCTSPGLHSPESNV